MRKTLNRRPLRVPHNNQRSTVVSCMGTATPFRRPLRSKLGKGKQGRGLLNIVYKGSDLWKLNAYHPSEKRFPTVLIEQTFSENTLLDKVSFFIFFDLLNLNFLY